jgi:hypothetical protein
LLQERGLRGTQDEIADALKMSQPWVSKYDPEPDTYHKNERLSRRDNLFSYSVWGFRDDSWRQLILKAEQPFSIFVPPF